MACGSYLHEQDDHRHDGFRVSVGSRAQPGGGLDVAVKGMVW
jgi:hypothetical protein